MTTIEKYLQVVPLPILLFGPAAAIAAFMLVPSRLRMGVSIALMVFWLPLSQYHALGFIMALAKATGFGVFVLVIVTAWMHPGPKRPVSGAGWAYVLIALLGFMYIFTVTDFTLALVMRVQWLLLVIAAIMVARTIVDERSLESVIKSITFGFGVALLVPLSALATNPTLAIRKIGRFVPYDIPPNHIGIVFAVAAPLLVYWGIRYPRPLVRGTLFGLAASAVLMGILTASRSTAVVMVGTLAPLFAAGKRGVIALGAIGALLMMALMIVSTENVALRRFATFETARVGLIGEYLGIIADRPLFGLLGTEGQSFEGAHEIGLSISNPHNAYIEILYFGGLSWGVPVFVMVGYTLWCTNRVWRERHWLGAAPLLISALVAIMVMTYAHGFVNRSLFLPTTSLAPIHVILSLFFIDLAGDLNRGLEYPLMPEDEYEELDHDDDVDFAAEPGA